MTLDTVNQPVEEEGEDEWPFETRRYRAVVEFENDGGDSDEDVLSDLPGQWVKVKSGQFDNQIHGNIISVEAIGPMEEQAEQQT